MSGFLERLAQRRRFGIRPGLETMRLLLGALGNPERGLRVVHVAGTNGKGAVAATLDAALRSCSYRVARYTSPHLLRLAERFCIDGAPMDDALLEDAASRVEAALSSPALAGAGVEATFFEALTAMAFVAFAEASVDVAVMEAGLGGRLDATNVCEPVLCVITRIGLDHCELLGATPEAIAAEKAGIVKRGAPIVLGRNAAGVREVVRGVAAERGAPFFYAPDIAGETDVPRDFPLRGAFNRENCVTALAALDVLKRDAGFPLGGFSLAGVSWPGRFQRIGRFLVDGAHNPPAAAALAAALAEELRPGEKVDLIAGFCSDKDRAAVLRLLAPLCSRAFAVRTQNPRSVAPETLAEEMRSAGMAAEAAATLGEAMARAAAGPAKTILVCGSLFLAGEALAALGAYENAPRTLEPAELP